MRKLIDAKIAGWLAGSLLTLLLAPACSDMNDLSDRFLNQGSTIYAAMVDSAQAHTGRNRIEIELYVETQRIDFVRVFWNNYVDSSDIIVANAPGVYRKMLDISEPSFYVFYLVSYDRYGNPSLPYEITGTVVGDEFDANLSQRRIIAADYDDVFNSANLAVSLAAAPEYAQYSELHYTNTSGKAAVWRVNNASANTVNIKNYDPAKGLKIVTYYKADASAVDVSTVEEEVHVRQPVLSQSLNLTFNVGTALGCTVTDQTDYIELTSTNADPQIATSGLEVNVRSSYRVIFSVDYQSDRRITAAQLLFGTPGFAEAIATKSDLLLENTGLAPTDPSKWKTFTYDCTSAISAYSWGSASHRLRFDFGGSVGSTVLFSNQKYEVWVMQ
ncbi:MAG: DUF4998 domain-containing protein [Bacteroidales bacterium]|jgi:hypothetical protein|nr:DUF4998 domain-containing protein [Bacteroidales bacterium]